MITKRIVCFTGVLWEILRSVVILRLGSMLLGQGHGFATGGFILWGSVGQVVMPVGFFFLALYPKRYSNYARLLAVGKATATLTGLAVLGVMTGLLPYHGLLPEGHPLSATLAVGFLFVVLLDLLFFLFLFLYPKVEAATDAPVVGLSTGVPAGREASHQGRPTHPGGQG